MKRRAVLLCWLAAALTSRHASGQRSNLPGTPNAEEGRIGAIGRVRVHATDEQREQVAACIRLLEVKTPLNADQLRAQITTLSLEHDKLIAGLDKHQREELKRRIGEINRARDRINTSLKKLKRPGDNTSATEQAMKQLQDQYRALQSDIEP